MSEIRVGFCLRGTAVQSRSLAKVLSLLLPLRSLPSAQSDRRLQLGMCAPGLCRCKQPSLALSACGQPHTGLSLCTRLQGTVPRGCWPPRALRESKRKSRFSQHLMGQSHRGGWLNAVLLPWTMASGVLVTHTGTHMQERIQYQGGHLAEAL